MMIEINQNTIKERIKERKIVGDLLPQCTGHCDGKLKARLRKKKLNLIGVKVSTDADQVSIKKERNKKEDFKKEEEEGTNCIFY